jgi:L-alanine-DL-glutamate epimerase-like enolase superfamily enzyme
MPRSRDTGIERVEVSVYRIPTETPESDGTLEWDSTTMVLVELVATDNTQGLGFTYASESAATLIREKLAEVVQKTDGLAINGTWRKMIAAVRNLGRLGIASTAISAVDVALWDLKAKVLGLPLFRLLGAVRDSLPCYGSGGFTSYSTRQLTRQLGDWADGGLRFVKMKIGREPERDIERVRAARRAIGKKVELFVDANGACSRKQALALAKEFSRYGVTWFEEPVSSDDLEGLRLIRDRAPAGMEIAAGEYGYDAVYFRRMLQAGAVDVLQPDATRCGGITGFLQAVLLAETFAIPISAHTAPSIHQHACCAVNGARHVEYFFDHARIEQMFFEGAARPNKGNLAPNPELPGLGLRFKPKAAERFRVQ